MKIRDRKALRERQSAFRIRRREQGFQRVEVWVHADDVERLRKYVAKNLRSPVEDDR